MVAAAIRSLQKSTPDPIESLIEQISDAVAFAVAQSIEQNKIIKLKAEFRYGCSRVSFTTEQVERTTLDFRSTTPANRARTAPEDTVSRNAKRCIGVLRQQMLLLMGGLDEWTQGSLCVSIRTGQVSGVDRHYHSIYKVSADC